MPVYKTPDGRYTYAIETPHEADGNSVVYDHWRENPNAPGLPYVAWDRWSYEAGLGDVALRPANPPSSPSQPPAPPSPEPAQPSGPSWRAGGFTVPCADTSVRRRFSADEIRGFLPARGAFSFPSPYNTTGVRLTNANDGTLQPFYPYWPKVNNHAGQPNIFVVVGRRGAPGLLFVVDKATLNVSVDTLAGLPGSGEQWYFSLRDPHVLYVTDGPRLMRYDVVTGERDTVWDVGPGRYLWQPHSSADGQTHSATLRQDGTWAVLGPATIRNGVEFTPSMQGDYDECQIDKSGEHVVIKEKIDGRLMNRHINLVDRETATVLKADHPLGHSDNGHGYMVGEDANHDLPGAFILRDLTQPRRQGRLVYHMHGWGEPRGMTRHCAHSNARPGSPDSQYVIISSAHRDDLPRANEIVKVPLDGSLNATVICPNLTDLDAQSGDDYEKLPMCTIDPPGEWICFHGNMGTDRLDLFLAAVPR